MLLFLLEEDQNLNATKVELNLEHLLVSVATDMMEEFDQAIIHPVAYHDGQDFQENVLDNKRLLLWKRGRN